MKRTVSIIGTGLIGASVGLALRETGWSAIGWDSHPDALELAADRGALDRTARSEDEAIADADLVVLAGPLSSIVETVGTLETGALVTDVAGVKVPVVEAAAGQDLRFVGGHPMAGREHAGPAAATAALFRGAAWILTDDGAGDEDIEELARIVTSIGAVATQMTADDHDRVVASVSHLPHLIATALVNRVAGDPGVRGLAAGSFRDLTRVAASDPGFWPEILVANRGHLSASLEGLVEELDTLRLAIVDGDETSIQGQLGSAQALRRDMAPPIVRVRVVLQDKPGEIAAVGRALEDSAVDVRDLQLRHAPHGGGGVLTLSVRPGESEPLKAALLAEGFTTE